ncbi:ParB/RepB/Spo0J family partition protein [Nocardia sp. GCM10030253]|uniref:ParB/RepB/Spo0J family partition protein n=1 Tax=Nocardia sp. GCM10030253 TaxID=3273404 RepID=UPI0036449AAB
MDSLAVATEKLIPLYEQRPAGSRGALLSEIAEVPIERIRVTDSPRTGGENARHISQLAEASGRLPPIVLHRQTMTVIDGVHRLRVAQQSGAVSINAVFFNGDERDAFVLAVQLNSSHGLPLSLADRKAAAVRILGDFPEWSDRRLAEVAGLSDKTIAAIRRRSGAEIPHPPPGRLGRDGLMYPNDSGDRRRRAKDFLEANPDASAREIALAAGISLTTAKNIRRRLRDVDSVKPQRRHEGSATAERSAAGAGVPGDGSPHVRQESADPMQMVRRLRADPSLRFTEVGRRLLRLLEVSTSEPVEWRSMATSLPIHCAPTVAELARQHAENWMALAESLSRRIDQSDG